MNTINVNPDYLRGLTRICAEKDIRFYLNGVCLEIRPRETRYIATDGHRLAILRDEVPENEPDQVPAVLIIPRDVCKGAKRAMKKIPLVSLQYDAAQPLAECRIDEGASVVFRPIDAKYPDFTRVVPSKVSGEPGAYKWQYLADFDDMTAIAFGALHGVELYQNGKLDCALIMHSGYPNFIGALMPMRKADEGKLPAWWTGRPDLKVAA